LKIWDIYVEEIYDRANRPENLNVELEVDKDHKGLHILHSEVEKAIKEMRDKKTTGDDLWKLSNCWEIMVSTY
jgi:hypothetical protein